MVLVHRHIRVLGGKRMKTFVPKRHRIKNAVGFGRRGHMLAADLARELERVADDAVGSAPGENRLLHHYFVGRTRVQPSADLRILTLGILAHDPEVDVSGLAVARRRDDAGQQTHGPEVYILIEFAPDRDQQTPQRHVVGNAGKAYGAKEDRVMVAKPRDSVGGHHAPGGLVRLTTPVEVLEAKADADLRASRFENPDALGDNFFADAVPGNDKEVVP